MPSKKYNYNTFNTDTPAYNNVCFEDDDEDERGDPRNVKNEYKKGNRRYEAKLSGDRSCITELCDYVV